jgi:hypothetical protein
MHSGIEMYVASTEEGIGTQGILEDTVTDFRYQLPVDRSEHAILVQAMKVLDNMTHKLMAS